MIGSIIGGGASLIGGILDVATGKKKQKRAQKNAKELLKEQEEAQERMNQANAERNYQYGEKSAGNAHERQIELMNLQQEQNSLGTKVQEAKDAGINPQFALGGAGGGGGGGGAAQGDGAGNQRSQAADYIAAMEAANNARLTDVEVKRGLRETALLAEEARNLKAERELKKAEAKKANEEAKTEEESRKWIINDIRENGWGKYLDNLRKNWEHGQSEYGTLEDGPQVEVFRSIDFEREGNWITSTPKFNEKEALEIASIIEDIEGKKLDRMLRKEEAERLWTLMLNEIKNGKQQRAESAARELATRWGIGEYKNWKTWTDTGTQAIGAISKGIQITR